MKRKSNGKELALVLRTFAAKITSIDAPRVYYEGQIVQADKYLVADYEKRGWLVPCTIFSRDDDVVIVRAVQGMTSRQTTTVIPMELASNREM